MANLLDIRRRIRSVKNTQQITKAMKMVSAARLKRAQDRVVAARPFANRMMEVLSDLARYTQDDFRDPLLDERGDSRYLLLLVTADRGLCGAFNANLVKAAQTFIAEHGGTSAVEILAVGRKGRDYFRRRGQLVGEYVGVTGTGRVQYSDAVAIARDVTNRLTSDESLDKVFIVYNEFKSVLQQRVMVEQLLPVNRAEGPDQGRKDEEGKEPRNLQFIYEQPPSEIFSHLLPRLIQTQVFRALLESAASEQGSRMTAMDAASKNAGDLIGTLTLNMNRIRQAAITKEIIEVVSGASSSAA